MFMLRAIAQQHETPPTFPPLGRGGLGGVAAEPLRSRNRGTQGGERLMSWSRSRTVVGSLLLAVGLMAAACAQKREGAASASPDPELAKRGSIEVTARLVEIPEGAIFERELYNYATVLKYQVL